MINAVSSGNEANPAGVFPSRPTATARQTPYFTGSYLIQDAFPTSPARPKTKSGTNASELAGSQTVSHKAASPQIIGAERVAPSVAGGTTTASPAAVRTTAAVDTAASNESAFKTAASSTTGGNAVALKIAEGKAAGRLKVSRYLRQSPSWVWYLTGIMVLLDALVMALSCAVVFLFRPDIYHTLQAQPTNSPLQVTGVFVLSWVLALLVMGCYRMHVQDEGLDLYEGIFRAGIFMFILVCCFGFVFRLEFPRYLVVLAILICGGGQLVLRWQIRRYLHRARTKGKYFYPVLLIGSAQKIKEATRNLLSGSGLRMGFLPVAVCCLDETEANRAAIRKALKTLTFPADTPDRGPVLTFLPLNSLLPQQACRLGVGVIMVVDFSHFDAEELRSLAAGVEAMNLELAFPAALTNLHSGDIRLRANRQIPLVAASLPQYSILNRALKRLLDILGSFCLLIPSLLIIAVAACFIKGEDGGKVFYRQTRLGLHGRPFQIYKLRSMSTGADRQDEAVAKQAGVHLGATFKVKADPRVTRVGRFIRKTSIDEIPQFFNVLKGDMSLVGPRPQRQFEVDQYSALYSTRLLVRPGITGPWQVSGRNNLSEAEAQLLDVTYVEHWSLLMDLVILMKTVVAVVRRDGAY